MRHVICFSGGADSTALCLWARENLPEFDTVFCDTGWEYPMTYDYSRERVQPMRVIHAHLREDAQQGASTPKQVSGHPQITTA